MQGKLVSCGTCNGQVSTNAESCPHCGERYYYHKTVHSECPDCHGERRVAYLVKGGKVGRDYPIQASKINEYKNATRQHYYPIYTYNLSHLDHVVEKCPRCSGSGKVKRTERR